ncbi:MAG TPA: homoserine kinase [Candidatus Eisenbacteria bacterium]
MTRKRPERWSAVAPGSTSNLGPGFDCLGLALGLRLKAVATRIPSGFSIRRIGEGSDLAIDPHQDKVLGAFRHLFRHAREPVPTVALTIHSEIPLARGLGSSASAIVAGLTLANHWMNRRFTPEELFREAIRLEGHPDNVAPAIFGGLTLSMPRLDGSIQALPLAYPRGLGLTLVVPDLRVSTEKARALLPASIPLRSGVENTARALALELALATRRFELLAEALRDVYHVPYRARLIPGFDGVVEAGSRAGAYGVTISGSGPTLLAFHAPGLGTRVGKAMVRAFKRHRVTARALPGRIATKGATASTLR